MTTAEQINDGVRFEKTRDKSPQCDCCQNSIPVDDSDQARIVRVQRGWFPIDREHGAIELEGVRDDEINIKCELYFCEKCYLEDPDLCRFFNRIGYRVR